MDIKRKYPRYPCDFEVKIIAKENFHFSAEACDISEEGIFLIVPIDSVAGLKEHDVDLSKVEKIKVALPNKENTAQFVINCKVAHCMDVKDVEKLLGLYFFDHRDEARAFVSELVANYK